MQKNIRPIAIALTILSALGRLLPHPPNVTPVGASSLFAGARLNGWMAYLLPILVMAATDPLVGGYSRATPIVYLSLLISVWIGRRLQSTDSALRIGGACVLSSVQFFVLTNLATWMFGALYAKSLAGLAACYVAALPFFAYTAIGDLFFTAAIFGMYAMLARTIGRSERTAHA
ncbi:MAG TPA: DUF6580 family putative transport protein [Bryobacteraceae bacterium]|jgi:hypothetical protein